MQNRTSPNILVTGLPGVGKSALCSKLSEQTGLKWLEVSRIIIENNFEKSNQIRLLNCIKEKIDLGGNIVDYYFCGIFPSEWFDIVIVLQADNFILYERCKKITFDDIAMDESRYVPSEIIYELSNRTWREFDENLKTIRMWLQKWYVIKVTPSS
ncbi:hypothetical protein ILUMI_27161 [Ignelater luminosus]|uniref:Adenylate kinase n=1 Tax=Ignelater luminosus TaxID=2038154 RepID=A0A8K0C8H4_IGNLU|nr:hypothetical protein ILUMI_27161 [Ignelater luminosus]